MHPSGARTNSIQINDIAVGWLSHEKAFYTQPYLIAILYKAIRHWLGPGLLTPYLNPWQSVEKHPRIKLRSRRINTSKKGLAPAFPAIKWGNNAPAVFSSLNVGPRRLFNPVVIRYYRRSRARLILREAGGDLNRPSVIYRRPRYTFTAWSRPKILRVGGQVFCVLKGLGAGERTPKPRRTRRWRKRVMKYGR